MRVINLGELEYCRFCQQESNVGILSLAASSIKQEAKQINSLVNKHNLKFQLLIVTCYFNKYLLIVDSKRLRLDDSSADV